MDDVNIQFAKAFRCPFPCKAEVLVDADNVAKYRVCGKKFNRGEITELLLSQGRFVVLTDGESSAGTKFDESLR